MEKCQSCGEADVYDDNLHTCPFQEDVNNDSEFECNCCEDCMQSCAEDV